VNLVLKEGFRMAKCWGMIYTCLVTRHVYLDLVMELSAEAFLKTWVPRPIGGAPEVKMKKFNQNLVLHSQKFTSTKIWAIRKSSDRKSSDGRKVVTEEM
jgi:hypothetical protein